MQNNSAYHQEVIDVRRVGNRRNHGVGRATIGPPLEKPFINLAMMAKFMGVECIGPTDDPKELGPALKRAMQMAKAGERELVDVLSHSRDETRYERGVSRSLVSLLFCKWGPGVAADCARQRDLYEGVMR